jgi:Arc/MetJ-type ribon-helix-helix transcriptional regulator
MINDTTAQKYFESASELLRSGLAQLRFDDAAAYARVSEAVANGATLSLTATIGKSGAGEAKCVLNLNDETVWLFGFDAKPQKAH